MLVKACLFILVQTGVSCKWTSDGQQFLLEHFDTIHDSPSQIYHSALPFSPSSSWLRKHYNMELSQALRVVKGLASEWGTCSRKVLLDGFPKSLSYGNNTVAVGLNSGDIIILDAITGSQSAILSGHTDWVDSVAFSPGGTSLVSGSSDKTVKLWDMQTGGVVKTFSGHTGWVYSVSISSDCTRIASGSDDETICLWDIQTGECRHVIKQQGSVYYVSFSPTDPGHFISISGSKVQQWNINGQQTGPTYDGSSIAFSPDSTQFALCNEKVVTVQNSDSRAVVAQFHVAGNNVKHCCFSPDGRLVAAAAGRIIYVWDVASSDPHLVETFVGHTADITSLVFSPSYLISTSDDRSVRFWQTSVMSTVHIPNGPGFIPPGSASIWSVSLQAGIAITSDSAGVVKIWDILTGLCKSSFQTPAEGTTWRDAQLIDGRLILIYCKDQKIHIWDAEKGEHLQTLNTSWCNGLRISGDRSKIFCLGDGVIQAWDMWTWKPAGEVKLESDDFYLDSACPDGSKVWVQSEDLTVQGWDFGTSDSPPIPLSKRFHLDFIGGPLWQTGITSWIKDTVTGKRVFQLSGRYAEFCAVQWDGQYLVAGYESGEVTILDFNDLVLSRDV